MFSSKEQNMKKVLFDLNHPCDINFFKNVISRFSFEGKAEIILTVLKRGSLPELVAAELPGTHIKVIGRHRGNFHSIIIEANIIKFFKLFFYVLKVRPVLCVSFGSFILGAVCKILRINNIQFWDDPENKTNKFLQKLTADSLYYPYFYNTDPSIRTFKALKEWAYLSPAYFKPNISVLKKYNLRPNNYIFIREVSTNTMNYRGQKSNLLYKLSEYIPNIKVLLSIEDKSKRYLYPDDWIVLKEPVDDIHSLLYYSKLVISSGDSMAREGSLLGVPSVYTGMREMAANKALEPYGTFFHYKVDELYSNINEIIKYDRNQEKVRTKINLEFIDLVGFILSLLNSELNNSLKIISRYHLMNYKIKDDKL